MIQHPAFQYVTTPRLRLDQLKFGICVTNVILLWKINMAQLFDSIFLSERRHLFIKVTFCGNYLQNVYKAENRLLFWLLIFFAFLIALAILTLLLCCACPWCPLYSAVRWVPAQNAVCPIFIANKFKCIPIRYLHSLAWNVSYRKITALAAFLRKNRNCTNFDIKI